MTVIIFLVVLFILVLVHEWGHFIVAKKSGIRVDEFAIGFPPKVVGKKVGETEYTLNWLPIGGFVRIWGEDPTEEHISGPDSHRSFVNKPRYIQALVLIAGVAMNVVLAFVLYTASYLIGMPTAVADINDPNVTDTRLIVTSALPEGPAVDLIKPGDQIVGARHTNAVMPAGSVASSSRVAHFIAGSNGAPVTLSLIRGGEPIEKTVQPVQGIIVDDPDRYAIGISMSFVGVAHYGVFTAVQKGVERTFQGLIDIAVGFGTLIARVFQGSGSMALVTGPVGIVGMVGDAAQLGFVWLLTFTAFISLNLAFINLLPIPALDGGRLLFVAIEAVTRRPIQPKIATRVNTIGFIALLALMALVTVFDILKLLH